MAMDLKEIERFIKEAMLMLLSRYKIWLVMVTIILQLLPLQNLWEKAKLNNIKWSITH